MRFDTRHLIAGLFTVLIMGTSVPYVAAEDLGSKTCPELLRLAKECEQDLKTVDTVLGAAIDAGNMDSVRNYKLKRSAMVKERENIMSAIKFKQCLKSK
jgi:hypothetical protein